MPGLAPQHPQHAQDLLLRPATPDDLDALLRLAAASSVGIGSLREDRAWLAERVARSQSALLSADDASGEESFLFVLEDQRAQRIVGCSGITARAGFRARFYSYYNEFIHAASPGLGLVQRTHTLHLGHDLTDATLLTSFYIEPGYADGPGAQLLSRARLLFLAQFADRFSERIASEHPGVLDANGNSPFWDAVGRRFFAMDYPQAESLAGGRSKAFIAELLPTSPVYVPLLPEAAQSAIGQLHPDGELPFCILQAEGFDTDSYVDVFDGGPTAVGRLQALASVRLAQPLRAPRTGGGLWLACTAQRASFVARLLGPGDDARQLLGTDDGLAVPLDLEGAA